MMLFEQFCVLGIAFLTVKLGAANPEQLDNEVVRELAKSIDSSISPCDDFYEFACGGWKQENPIPPGHSMWSVDHVRFNHSRAFIFETLNGDIKSTDQKGEKIAKSYFDICLNHNATQWEDLTPLKEEISRILGGWRLLPKGQPGGRSESATDEDFLPENFDAIDIFAPILKHGFFTNLLRIDIAPNVAGNLDPIVYLYRSDLPETREAHYGSTNKTLQQPFIEGMAEFARLLGVAEDPLEAMEKVYEFQKLMALTTIRDNFNNLDIKNLTVSELQTSCPIVNWKKLLKKVTKNVKPRLEETQLVGFYEHEAFMERCEIFKTYLESAEKIKVLHDAAILKLISKLRSYIPNLDGDRSRFCFKKARHFFKRTLGRLYVDRMHGDGIKEEANIIVEEVRKSLEDSFATLDWMDDATRNEALEKLSSMSVEMAYPDWIKNIQVEKEQFRGISIRSMQRQTFLRSNLELEESFFAHNLKQLVDESYTPILSEPYGPQGFYDPMNNRFLVTLALLLKPFFSLEYPQSVNYGAIGSVMGHEMLHGYDRVGLHFDGKGHMRNWWTNESKANFHEISQCFIDQYNMYEVHGFGVNGDATVLENIPDNGGIRAAYRAYMRNFEYLMHDHPIKNLDYTNEQLFFIGWSQNYCWNATREAEIYRMTGSRYPTKKIRVNGAVVNMKEFSRAFHCKAGSRMNPEKRCVLY